ncbi:hypothetical protein MLD52_05710 [Puniceicoccaceae bacterium K14]|nr:hypothetical protein [Puniceicoccaceae bacterium K14]
MNAKKVFFTLALATLTISLTGAGEWSGYGALELKGFEESPAFNGQENSVGIASVFEPQYYQDWKDGYRAFEFSPYFRWDSLDSERNLVDVRELSYLYVEDNWELKIGVSKVFWGVAESQHLVDVVNQTDLVANPDGEDKLGQPMVQYSLITNLGDFSLFVLPWFRERTFAGEEGRSRSALPVDLDNATYESSAEESHVDFALRWFHIIGNFDIGLHYFRGTRRDPIFSVSEDGSKLFPHYEQMDQIGLDLQYTQGGLLLKLEALGRETESEDFSAAVGGFEYTLYGIANSAMDAGLLVEAHLDSRGAGAPNPFNRDVFVGSRLTWNDSADSSLVAGVFYDWDLGSLSTRVEFEKRIGNSLKLEVELQRFSDIDEKDPLISFSRDSYLQVTLSRYF